jgi:hypothetical protein
MARKPYLGGDIPTHSDAYWHTGISQKSLGDGQYELFLVALWGIQPSESEAILNRHAAKLCGAKDYSISFNKSEFFGHMGADMPGQQWLAVANSALLQCDTAASDNSFEPTPLRGPA